MGRTIESSSFRTAASSVYLLLTLAMLISCSGQEKKNNRERQVVSTSIKSLDTIPEEIKQDNYNYGLDFLQYHPEPISEFVRRIFQDGKGNLWFGTNGDGVIRYGPNSKLVGQDNILEYFSINEGFGGRAVRGIVEDKEGNIWFGTSGGITKYNGKAFINYSESDGLASNSVWAITIDRNNIIWVGTLEGISRFDGKDFTPFELPESQSDSTRGVTSTNIVHSIMQDSKGRMWFGTNGGAYIFDPEVSDTDEERKSLSNISIEDGLPDNNVNCILEDDDGNYWFATHHKGVCRWDPSVNPSVGNGFTYFTEEQGVYGIEVWDLYKDSAGRIWFPSENYGMYRIDPATEKRGEKSITNFHKDDGLASHAIQCTFEDKEGRLWFGGWLGLFRYDPDTDQKLEGGKTFVSVTQKGPWD